MEIATLGGGCFWCLEAILEQLDGVESVVSGFSGGNVLNPAYREVCDGTTGHAEVVQVTFDPDQISYSELLEVFFAFHDPTTMNQQGADVGTQYRSAIYSHSPEQRKAAEAAIRELNESKAFPDPIVTEVTSYSGFYRAEDYHQGYYRKNTGQPYCAATITPKVAKLRAKFAERLKK